VLIVLALVVGEHWYGIAGALLAVPVASVVVAVFKFLHRRTVEMDEQLARAAAAPAVPPPAA
jgi:predicted PurR-regulated permease PerM